MFTGRTSSHTTHIRLKTIIIFTDDAELYLNIVIILCKTSYYKNMYVRMRLQKGYIFMHAWNWAYLYIILFSWLSQQLPLFIGIYVQAIYCKQNSMNTPWHFSSCLFHVCLQRVAILLPPSRYDMSAMISFCMQHLSD